jgi:type IV pilus assembly protein PilC
MATLRRRTTAQFRLKRRWWNYEITSRKVKLEELMNFSRQCSAFVAAGIPIVDALLVIAEDNRSKLLRQILRDAADRISQGTSLSEALTIHASALPNYYVPMIRAAELTGRLDEVLDQLAAYLSRDIEARRRIRSALTYPAVVMVMTLVTVGVLAGWVLPQFKSFFESFGAELPLITRILLGITDFVTSWYIIGLAVLAVLAVVVFGVGKTSPGRYYRDAALLRLPLFGTLLRFSIVERFCRILASMVQAGVPLPDAVHVAAESSSNGVYRRALSTVRESMMRGEGLATPLAASRMFPAGANQMLRVGEATGTLDRQLHTAATFYERELDYRMRRLTDLFEPAVIIVVGVIVGFVAVALISAMYGIYRQVPV